MASETVASTSSTTAMLSRQPKKAKLKELKTKPALSKPTVSNPLSPELLLIIFKKVADQDTPFEKISKHKGKPYDRDNTDNAEPSFSRLRLVCKDWDAAAILIQFLDVDLNPLVARCGILSKAPSDPAISAIQEYLRENMQVATIDGGSVRNWKQLVKFLQECKKLNKIRFDFPRATQICKDKFRGVDNPEKTPLIDIPKRLCDAFFDWGGKVKLDLGEEEAGVHQRNGWRFFYWTGEQQWTLVAPSICSLKLYHHSPLQQNSWRLARLKELIIASKQMEGLVLHVPTYFRQDPHGSLAVKFPPLKKLKVINYDFRSTSVDDWTIWDFSKLTSLEAVTTFFQLEAFLGLAAAEDFPNLSALTFANKDDPSYLEIEHYPQLLSIFISRLRGLTSLSIDLFDPETTIPEILKLGSSLRVLELRHRGYATCTELLDLDKIRKACRNIRVLEVRIDINDVVESVNFVMCEFKRLEHLKIELWDDGVWNHIDKNSREEKESDNRSIAADVTLHKTGLPLKSLQIIRHVDIDFIRHHMLEYFDWPYLSSGGKTARRRASNLSFAYSEPDNPFGLFRRLRIHWERMPFYPV